MFHNNFWANLEMNLDTGNFQEKTNLPPTVESLYNTTEPQWMVEHLKDDLALQLFAYKMGYITNLDREVVGKLAACLKFPFDWSQRANLQSQAGALLDCYSLQATCVILEKARDFARQHDKKLLVVLFDPYRAMTETKDTGKRYDQGIVDYLAREKFNYFDMNEVQLCDSKKYNISYRDYMKQYLVGYYNPRGNHFFAYLIKDKVVEWLDPKPISYGRPDPKGIDFKGYLPDYH